MTVEELKSVFKDAFAIELKPGTETIVFVDRTAIDSHDIEDLLDFGGSVDVGGITFDLVATGGNKVTDCITAMHLPRK